MIIAGLSDIHGKTSRMEKLGELSGEDLVLLVGDITHFGKKDAAQKVLGALSHCPAKILAVPGNCDHPEVGRFLDDANINIHARHRVMGGVAFLGIGASLPTPFNTPYEISEAAFERALTKAAANLPGDIPLILVAHQPPIHTACDRIHDGTHVGSRSVRNFIERHRPLVCFTGHIHESRAIDHIGETAVINPGSFAAGGYARVEVAESLISAEILDL